MTAGTDIHDLPQRQEVEGLVLCGGAGRRMQGRDKGLLPYEGAPMALRVARQLQPLCAQVFLSANRHHNRYRALNIGPVFADKRSGFAGPLAGLETAVGHLRADIILVSPCDLPRLDPKVPGQLLRALHDQPELQAVYARTEEREHYLSVALRRPALGSLKAYLDHGERSVHGWLKELRTGTVLFTDALARSLENVNRYD